MIELIVWIVFGAIVGWVASLIMGTNGEQGAFGNVIIGIAGALIGGFIARSLGAQGVNGFDVVSFLVALGGAIVLILAIRAVRRAVGHGV